MTDGPAPETLKGRSTADFPSTHWSAIMIARAVDSDGGRAALTRLCESYWQPLYAFARRSGRGTEDAEDMTQAFFARLLEKDYLRAAQADRGRFRSFLLASFKHFLANEWDRSQALRRGGHAVRVPFEISGAAMDNGEEPIDPHTPETLYDQRWALAVVARARRRLAREYETSGKIALFRELESFLGGTERAEPHAEIAKRHGISVTTVGVAVHRMRRRFGELLRDEVAQTVSHPSEVESEIEHLLQSLGR